MLQLLFGLVFTFIIIPMSWAEPFWGSKTSQPLDTLSQKLKPGQFIWKGDSIPAGPTVAEINLAEQRFYLYRNGVLIGLSTTSTGKYKRSTPTGIFSVLSKIRYHRSRKYNNAPMPYTQHITRSGIAMHAGYLPGYPASHGCIRLPSAFAQRLFKSSYIGMPVVISRHKTTLKKERILSANEAFRWQPEKSDAGAVSILISRADQRILVYRHSIEIGRAKFSLISPDKAFGTHAYLLHQKKEGKINPFLNQNVTAAWVTIALPGFPKAKETFLGQSLLQRIKIPLEFAKAINSILTPGTSLYITDSSILQHEISDLALTALLRHQQPVPVIKPQTPMIKIAKEKSTKDLIEIERLKKDMSNLQNQVEQIKNELNSIEKQL